MLVSSQAIVIKMQILPIRHVKDEGNLYVHTFSWLFPNVCACPANRWNPLGFSLLNRRASSPWFRYPDRYYWASETETGMVYETTDPISVLYQPERGPKREHENNGTSVSASRVGWDWSARARLMFLSLPSFYFQTQYLIVYCIKSCYSSNFYIVKMQF